MYNIKELFKKKEISGEELEYLLLQRKDNKADFFLLDVREEYEYDKKRIAGVDSLIPLSKFFNKVEEIESYKTKNIIVTCKLGGRSAQVQTQLKLMGFDNVINLAGGISYYKGKTIG